MSDYERTTPIQAPAESVFAWVSDLANLPRYLPKLHAVEREGEGRIRVSGEAHRERLEAAGEFHSDPERLRMWWSTEGDHRYKGWLQVEPAGDHTDVTVHLFFSFDDKAKQRMAARGYDPGPEIEGGLARALASIRDHVEREYGGVGPRREVRPDRDYPQPPVV